MKNTKRFWKTAMILFCMIVLLSATLILSAAAETDSGTCGAEGDGTNLTWSLDTETGILAISGTGEMANYSGGSYTPWNSYLLSIKKVIISDGVASIGNNAFNECCEMTDIALSKTIERIGEDAFVNCDKLTVVTLPDSLKTIGNSAFNSCNNLVSISISEGLTSIGYSAFNSCTSLEDIVLPESLTALGEIAFLWCSALNSVTFYSETAVIFDSENTIPAQATIYGYADSTAEAYATKYSRTFVELEAPEPEETDPVETEPVEPDPVETEPVETEATVWASGTCGTEGNNLKWKMTSDGVLAISGTGNMSDFSVLTPWNNYCDTIQLITVAEGVTSIGKKAFAYCTAVTEISLPESLTKIGSESFMYCKSLGNLTLPKNLTEIGFSSFEGCSSLVGIDLPSTLKTIKSSAFSGCTSLTKIVLPEGVKSVSTSAFYGCGGITEIALPESLVSIEDYAFCDCIGLTEITIPASVTKIGIAALSCRNLEEIKLAEGNTAYYVADNCLIEAATGTLVTGWKNSKIPTDGSVTAIADYAFQDCKDLGDITIPEGVKSIGKYAFSECSGLTSVTLPESATNVGYCAFVSCDDLEGISFLSKETAIYSSGNTVSKTATIYGYADSTAEEYATKYSRTFEKLPAKTVAEGTCGAEGDNLTWKLTNDGVLTISGEGAMADYDMYDLPWDAYRFSIKSVIIGDAVSSISSYAFFDFHSIKSITVPQNITRIGDRAFACGYLEEIKVAEGNAVYHSTDNCLIETATKTLIAGCESSKIPTDGSVEKIGDSAFEKCHNLTVLEIPVGVKSIGHYAFLDCAGLASVMLPDGLTSIGDYAFDYCKSLTEVTLPESLTIIGNNAFSYCVNLVSITIPKNVTIIGFAAFTACENLEEIKVADGNTAYHVVDNCLVETATKELIAGCKNSKIPSDGSVTGIRSYAFYHCSELKSITIPQSVTEIGNNAFSHCTGLKSIIFLSQTTTIYDDETVFPETAVIYGYEGSTAEAYAKKYNRAFVKMKGSCGDGVTFRVNTEGDLTISGTGAIKDYTDSVAPWAPQFFGKTETFESITSGVLTSKMLNETGTFPGLSASVSNSSGKLSVVEGSSGKYIHKAEETATTINYAANDSSIFQDKFEIAFDYRLDSYPNNSGIVALNNRNAGAKDEMRILSARAKEGGNVDIVFGVPNDWSSVPVVSDMTSPRWISFRIIVDPATLNYEIWVDGALKLYTVTEASAPGGHSVWVLTDGVWENVTRTGFQNESSSPFTNISGKVNSVYFFHYCLASFSIDNLYIAPMAAPWIETVEIEEGVTSIGANAFADCVGIEHLSVPASVVSVGSGAFDGSGLKEIELLSPTVKIADHANTIPEWTVIHGHRGSTAEAYAKKYNRAFEELPGMTVIAEGTCNDNLTWTLTEGGLLTVSGTGRMTIESMDAPWAEYRASIQCVIIESGVTSIGDCAFYNHQALKDVLLPESLTRIGMSAFEQCTALKAITIPNKVTKLDNLAFHDCTALADVTLPKGLESLGIEVFGNCESLTSITLPSKLTYISSLAFASCTNLKSITLPTNLKTMNSFAFSECAALSDIVLPAGLTSIDEYAFNNCVALTSLTLPEGLKNIKMAAFSGCTGLTDITIPAGVTQVGESAFVGCIGLESITFPSKTTAVYDMDDTIPENATIYAFAGSPAAQYAAKYGRSFVALTNVSWTLSEEGVLTVTCNGEMDDYTSGGAPWNASRDKIKKVVIEEGATTIGSNAFYKCSNLTSVSLPSTLTEIGVSAFALCSSLNEVDLPAGVLEVKSYAFYKSGLADIYFRARTTNPDFSVNTIPETATIHCIAGSRAEQYATKFNRKTEEIIITDDQGLCGADMTWEFFSSGELVISGSGEMNHFATTGSAPWYAYRYKIKTVTVEEGVESIGKNAFYNCYAITKVSLSSTVKTLYPSAFALCKVLTEIEIPATVEMVDSYAFYKSGLTDIYFLARETALNTREQTIPETATIHCIAGSKAEQYANKHGRPISAIVIADASGSCGENVTWEFFSDGHLVISGEGAMTELASSERPGWYNKYRDKVTTVTVEEGVTSIGAYTFQKHGNIVSVSLPSTLKTIGSSAFALCAGLREVDIPESVTNIGSYAFYKCAGLSKITINSAETKLIYSANTLPSTVIIYGHEDSFAESYAKKYKVPFVWLSYNSFIDNPDEE